jgi:hypothetical protein
MSEINKICQLEDINMTNFIKDGEFNDSPENINILNDILASYIQEELRIHKDLLFLQEKKEILHEKIQYLTKLLSNHISGGADVPHK